MGENPTPQPDRRDNVGFVFFSDPDGTPGRATDICPRLVSACGAAVAVANRTAAPGCARRVSSRCVAGTPSSTRPVPMMRPQRPWQRLIAIRAAARWAWAPQRIRRPWRGRLRRRCSRGSWSVDDRRRRDDRPTHRRAQALDRRSVDFIHARIHVRRTWDRKAKAFTKPTSRRSERAVPMPDEVATYLERLLKTYHPEVTETAPRSAVFGHPVTATRSGIASCTNACVQP